MEAILDLAIGATFLALGWWLGRRAPHSPISPPATVRQLARAARANRLELRTALPFKRVEPPRALDHFDTDGEETHP